MVATLWILAALAVLGIALPLLFALFGWTIFRARGSADPTQVQIDNWNDPFEAPIYEQLSLLGMEPLGIVREQAWFAVVHWYKQIELKVFGSEQHNCYVVVYRLVPGEPVRVALVTCFEEGGLVWTANHTQDLTRRGDRYLRWGVATSDLAELLARHEEVARPILNAGHPPTRHDDVDTLARALMAADSHQFVSLGERATLLVAALLGPAFAFLLSAAYVGLFHWLTPLAVLAGCGLWLASLQLLILKMAHDRRTELQQQEENAESLNLPS